MNDFEVLIVGAGPVGLTLAIDLVSRRIALRIIDKATTLAVGTRARGVSPRTQGIFEDLGVLKTLATYASPRLPMRFYDSDNNLAREINSMANPAAAPTSGAPYRMPLMVSQVDTETVLRERLAVFGYEVETGCALLGFVQHGDMVLATVEYDGEIETFYTQYLIGCYGRHSIVRKTGNFSFLI